MKGCLKLARGSTRRCAHTRKCVAFCAEGSEEVHVADEWDRSPAPPARKLSYQDILELKEIQRSLPRAEQIPDPLSSAPNYLRDVPLALLPLLPNNQPTAPPSTPSTSPPRSSVLPNLRPRPFPTYPPPSAPVYHPPSLAHLPTATPTPRRQKPTFHFIPLLNTPPSTPSSSVPSSASSSPPFGPHESDSGFYTTSDSELDSPISPILPDPMQLPPGYAIPPSHDAIPPEPVKHEIQYMIINGVKVPLDDPLDSKPLSPAITRNQQSRRRTPPQIHTRSTPLSPPSSRLLYA